MLICTQGAAISIAKPAFRFPVLSIAFSVGALLLFMSTSCIHRTRSQAPTAIAADNSYLDLTPGGRLRIVVPLLKEAGLPPATQTLQQDSNTFLVSAANLAGYDVSYYSIERASRGRVCLKFTAAEITRDGKTIQASQAPALPFALPLTARHIRLIYLIRRSQSDHNMAIAASKDLESLNTFTKRLEEHSDVCKSSEEVFCCWVPLGIAVRPESQP